MLFKVKLFRREKIEGPKKDTQLMHKNLGVLASSLSWNLWLVNYLPTEAEYLSQVLGCPGLLAEQEPLASELPTYRGCGSLTSTWVSWPPR